MTRRKWYSPQLSRQVVSRLYYQAKTERIPMTVLANRIIERALGPNEPSDICSILRYQKFTIICEAVKGISRFLKIPVDEFSTDCRPACELA
jgi:hypothetical protein